MNFLDFLSDSPKLFIFQKEVIKTNFGGVLFLLYIITMILISLAYLLAYSINDKYNVEIATSNNMTATNEFEEKEIIEELNKDEELNPLVNFTIILENRELMFGLYDNHLKKYINSDGYWQDHRYNYTITRRRISDFDISVHYKCFDDKNCKSIFDYESIFRRKLYLLYTGFVLDHSAVIPLKINPDKPNYISPYDDSYYQGNVKLTLNWEVIKYKDEKSLIDSLTKNKKEYIYGYIKRDYQIKTESYETNKITADYNERIGYYVKVFDISIKNDHHQFLFYKRKKIEILDVLANIGALFSTIKFFFALAFNFYYKNFSNYKIIGKILDYSKKPIQKIKLSSDVNISKFDEDKKDQLKDIEPLIEKTSEEKKINIKNNEICEDISENDIDDNNSIVLNKLSFFDFFFNNVYCKCCKKIRNQEIINSVNEVVFKYLSIDSLLYNQLKLEKFFMDYKWNNPKLKNILNNKMIMKIKNI